MGSRQINRPLSPTPRVMKTAHHFGFARKPYILDSNYSRNEPFELMFVKRNDDKGNKTAGNFCLHIP